MLTTLSSGRKITDWKFFKEVEYTVVDLKIEGSTSGTYDRGDQTPPFNQNAILADGSTMRGPLTVTEYDEEIKDAHSLSQATGLGANGLLSSWSNGGYLTVVGFAKFAFELTFSKLAGAQLPNVLVSIIMCSVNDSTKGTLKRQSSI